MRKSSGEKCVVCGEMYSCHYGGKPYCNKHYQKMRLYGHSNGKSRNTNQFIIDGDLLEIVTKNGTTILADADDYEKLKNHSWCLSKTGYAVAYIQGKTRKLHRHILGLENPEIIVDHKNHNILDNRKSNLRICTTADNMKNIGPKNGNIDIGIRMTKHGTYNVRITVNRKQVHIGNYATLEEARKARVEAEDKYHGEYGYHKSMEE